MFAAVSGLIVDVLVEDGLLCVPHHDVAVVGSGAATRTSTAARARRTAISATPPGRTRASPPLAQGPYHPIPIRPGTLGTCGGLVTDDDGRVLDRRRRPVPGLYAAGNVSAAVFDDAYPGGVRPWAPRSRGPTPSDAHWHLTVDA